MCAALGDIRQALRSIFFLKDENFARILFYKDLKSSKF
jgi:hypothetical protein